MTTFDSLTLVAAVLAGLECFAGRLAALDRREHRPSLLLGYFLAFAVCVVAGSMLLQRLDVTLLDWAVWVITAHLLFTWRAWRSGPPVEALRQPGGAIGAAVPSRIDRH